MYPILPSTALRLLAVSAVLLLAGCEIPGLGPDPRIAQREEESKAIGGACRHALRGLEDCYTLNPKASKASGVCGLEGNGRLHAREQARRHALGH
jgi:hypothetical protein